MGGLTDEKATTTPQDRRGGPSGPRAAVRPSKAAGVWWRRGSPRAVDRKLNRSLPGVAGLRNDVPPERQAKTAVKMGKDKERLT